MLSWIRQEKVTATDTTLSITLLRQLSYLSHCLSTSWLSLSKYLKESDLEYLVASPVGDALLSSPGSSRAIQTNSHFLPVFQPLCHSVFPVVVLQRYSHYKYTPCLTGAYFISVILLLQYTENVPGFTTSTKPLYLTFHRRVNCFLHYIQVISFY